MRNRWTQQGAGLAVDAGVVCCTLFRVSLWRHLLAPWGGAFGAGFNIILLAVFGLAVCGWQLWLIVCD